MKEEARAPRPINHPSFLMFMVTTSIN